MKEKSLLNTKIPGLLLLNMISFYMMKGDCQMLYAIDLFCGAGGMSEGMLQAGFHILFSNDINEDVQKTYMNRHEQLGYIQGYNTYFCRDDIRNINGNYIMNEISSLNIYKDLLPPKIDAIFGGPPCQGFSRAGRRSKDDPRNLLFKEYLRIIKEVQPNYVVMENVVGLLDMEFNGFIGVSGTEYENGTVTPIILENELDILGYESKMKILNASEYGVPQRRNRVIFLVNKKGITSPEFPKPKISNIVTIDDAIGDLNNNKELEGEIHFTRYQLDSRNGRTPNVNGEVVSQRNIILNNELSKHSKLIMERFSLYREGEDSTMLKCRIRKEGIDISENKELIEFCRKEFQCSKKEVIKKFNNNPPDEVIDILLTKKNMRIKLQRDIISPTVVTLPDDYISPYANRTFSVRELARLQSFDDSFEFLGKRTTGGSRRKIDVPQYSQVGNAVPPLLAKAIAEEVAKAINKNNK